MLVPKQSTFGATSLPQHNQRPYTSNPFSMESHVHKNNRYHHDPYTTIVATQFLKGNPSEKRVQQAIQTCIPMSQSNKEAAANSVSHLELDLMDCPF